MEKLASFSCQGPDVEAFRQICAPQVVCEFVGDRSKIFYAGRHQGIDALAGIVRSIGVEFQQVGSATSELVVEGGSLAMRRKAEWRHWGTGRRGVVDFVDFARFEDGLIVEFVEFRDNAALLLMQN
jgi:hypothetical protein